MKKETGPERNRDTRATGGFSRIQGREERAEINCINAVAHAAKKKQKANMFKMLLFTHTQRIGPGRARQDEAPRKSPGPQN